MTSLGGDGSIPARPPSVDMADIGSRQVYKSFKKKYKKLRHTFDEKMRLSNNLFCEEQKAIRIARRLQEQNDQLLELLLDINESSRIPPYLRYDLKSPTPSESAVPALEPDQLSGEVQDIRGARAVLDEAKSELEWHSITAESYRHLEASLKEAFNNPKRLSQLSTVTHTTLGSVQHDELPHDLNDEAPIGYLSPTHEEEYLSTLDSALETSELGAQLPPSSHPIRSSEKHERERDAALRNPVSVYNWLRKHHVFPTDIDYMAEKPTPRLIVPPRAPKRSSLAPRQEPEVIDEEGHIIGGNLEGSTRMKRKREDEPYRPKGGSSRSSRKKRFSGGNGEKRKAGEDEGS